MAPRTGRARNGSCLPGPMATSLTTVTSTFFDDAIGWPSRLVSADQRASTTYQAVGATAEQLAPLTAVN